MLHLLQQHLLLPEQFFGAIQQVRFLMFDRPAGRDVAERQKDRRIGAIFVKHLSSVQEHRLAANTREIMLDLEAVHGRSLGNDRLKQDAKRRNVPLAVAQRVKQAAARLFGIDLERLVE